ncbi:MAG TPA: NAD(P)H-binding protein [Terriglobales bacterium]|nr:NAD(P)H-binding protein [Terriglobales bacterium]
MKVLVIASSRRIRRQLIEQARGEGHEVTALEEKLPRFRWRRPKHRVVAGDVLSERSLAPAVAGQNAVLCWLTQKATRQTTTYLWEGTANLIRTMEKHGVRRLICISACGAGDSRGHCGFFYDKIIQPLFLKHVFEDRDRQEELIRGTQLDWVIVRPARLSNGRSRGEYMVLTDLRNFRARRIAVVDAVEFALKQLSNNFYIFQAPVLTY